MGVSTVSQKHYSALNPNFDKQSELEFNTEILEKTLTELQKEGLIFNGFIFFGVMITKKGLYLLEYNLRLGDPETQAILPLMQTDLVKHISACLKGELNTVNIGWKKGFSCCVVLASGGYPKNYRKGYEIRGIREFTESTMTFIAGATKPPNSGSFITSGGRVLNVVAIADNLDLAIKKAYDEVNNLYFTDVYFRKDIGS